MNHIVLINILIYIYILIFHVLLLFFYFFPIKLYQFHNLKYIIEIMGFPFLCRQHLLKFVFLLVLPNFFDSIIKLINI
jgi:hypothetical protein